MTNFEKYIKLHDEIMHRLKEGELTIETAKELSDAIFNASTVISMSNSCIHVGTLHSGISVMKLNESGKLISPLVNSNQTGDKKIEINEIDILIIRR